MKTVRAAREPAIRRRALTILDRQDVRVWDSHELHGAGHEATLACARLSTWMPDGPIIASMFVAFT
jgi:hypothetical protein